MAIALVSNTEKVRGTSPAIDTTGATLLVAVAGDFNTLNISDSKSNTWTKLTQVEGPFAGDMAIYYVANPTVGTNHTFTTNQDSICVAAFSDVATVSPFNKEGASATGSGTVQAGAVTPDQDNSLIIAAVGDFFEGVLTVNGGFTITDYINAVSGSEYSAGLAYLVQTTAASAQPTFTGTGGTFNSFVAYNAVFKPAVVNPNPFKGTQFLQLLGVGT